ncbi:acto-N-neotetraose biosynthesis glycosyltransferase LgtB [Pasteurella dagmatis ATCC 43325]|uniref:Acto-N-neotetraose biosynthesis glycosyltransferase LgtB n=2 Tax=Pasteurella dagmatis TaxID=754 RepID=C9PMA8_9PAST|nr:acto-N-neotetraose biosynthesis glycosyltransferase LgtB [Pasteurella dagmatis ATCC 43325]
MNFMSLLKNYVISLSSATDRRKHILEEFYQHNIPFLFFDALSPSLEFNQLVEQLIPNLSRCNLTNGEKGCLMSHLSLWHKCVEENLPYIGVFEDDILLGKDAEEFLASDEWIHSRFQHGDNFIIRLETFLQKVLCDATNISPYLDRDFLKLRSTHFGTAGYIISFSAAKYFLNIFANMKEDEIEPIDQLIFDRFLPMDNFQVYQLSPAICIQELQVNQEHSLLSSQLEDERIIARLDRDRKRKQKKIKDLFIHFLKKPQRMIEKSKKKRIQLKNNENSVVIEFK